MNRRADGVYLHESVVNARIKGWIVVGFIAGAIFGGLVGLALGGGL
jgi:outer membrane lipoprotein SlyB